jgi:Holliday junction resolvase
MSSNYERELKNILSGKKIPSFFRKLDKTKQGKYLEFIKKPFIVIRATGSLGIADLVTLRGGLSSLIEIKSSAFPTFHFSHQKRLLQQAEQLKKACEQANALPIYAYYLKYQKVEHWRLFTLDLKSLDGQAKLIHQRLPKLDRTKEGNLVMQWERGMKLSDFLSLIS